MPRRPRITQASEGAETDGAVLFRIAEKALVGLYDRGVLSPAVAEQCIAAFSGTAIDWDTAPTRNASDGKTVLEVLAAVLMPGQATRAPAKAVHALIAQIEPAPGSQDDSDDDDDDSDDELVAQFTAAAGRTRKAATGKAKAAPSGTAQPRGFAPLVNAKLPRTKR